MVDKAILLKDVCSSGNNANLIGTIMNMIEFESGCLLINHDGQLGITSVANFIVAIESDNMDLLWNLHIPDDHIILIKDMYHIQDIIMGLEYDDKTISKYDMMVAESEFDCEVPHMSVAEGIEHLKTVLDYSKVSFDPTTDVMKLTADAVMFDYDKVIDPTHYWYFMTLDDDNTPILIRVYII